MARACLLLAALTALLATTAAQESPSPSPSPMTSTLGLPATVPDAPFDIKVTRNYYYFILTATQLDYYTVVPGIASYRVFAYGARNNLEWEASITTTTDDFKVQGNTITLMFPASKLPNPTYYFALRAINGKGLSKESRPLVQYPPGFAPGSYTLGLASMGCKYTGWWATPIPCHTQKSVLTMYPYLKPNRQATFLFRSFGGGRLEISVPGRQCTARYLQPASKTCSTSKVALVRAGRKANDDWVVLPVEGLTGQYRIAPRACPDRFLGVASCTKRGPVTLELVSASSASVWDIN